MKEQGRNGDQALIATVETLKNNLSEILERFREVFEDVKARRGPRCCSDNYAVGASVFDMDGRPLKRCTSCGIPRGTLRHGLLCMAMGCTDPDANGAGVSE